MGDLFGTLSTVSGLALPVLGGVLGGPAGAAAGSGLGGLLGNLFGGGTSTPGLQLPDLSKTMWNMANPTQWNNATGISGLSPANAFSTTGAASSQPNIWQQLGNATGTFLGSMQSRQQRPLPGVAMQPPQMPSNINAPSGITLPDLSTLSSWSPNWGPTNPSSSFMPKTLQDYYLINEKPKPGWMY